MRVIHYPRVSSSRQAKLGDSIDAQINNLNKHSKENNDEVVGIYTDAGKSASISDDKMDIEFKNDKLIIKIDLKKRVGLTKGLNEIQQDKWDGIKFVKWDRLSRNNIVSKILQIYLARHKKKLIPTDDSTDPLMIEIRGVLSEEEIRKMKERVRQTRLQRFERGVPVARPPFGYRLNKKKKIMEIDKKKSEIVKKIFKMALEGIDYKIICKEVGLAPQQYYNIIGNKVYAGIVEFEGKIKRGIHSALVGISDFKKLNPDFVVEETI